MGTSIHLSPWCVGGNVVLCYGGRVRHPNPLWIINLSGRYVMPRGPKLHLAKQLEQVAQDGCFDWHVRVRGIRTTLRITTEMIQEFSQYRPEEGIPLP